MAATNDQIHATIERYVEVFSAGDRAGYLSLFADDATVEDPVGADVVSGPEGIASFWDGVRAMSPDIELQLTGAPRLAAGEAAFPMRAITTLGDAKLAVEIIDVMTFADDGRITSLRAFWDFADMAPYEG
ncbi:MAG: nuclear transport factor 2 family protein [Acidimicrobiales bacterium]